jgi:signal transduction histidine kinase
VTGAPVTAGDPGHLTRLVRNIVDNAVRHATSTVDVAAETCAGRKPCLGQELGF